MRPQRAISSLCRHGPELLSPPKFNYLLQLCSNSKAVAQVKQVHQQMILHGAAEDPFTATKLVQLYADTDDLVMVHKMFDRLPDPNVYAWTAILAFYLRHGMYIDCAKAFGKMKFNAILPDSYVFPKILRACAQVKCLEAGVQVHKDVIVCGCELNLGVSNSLIDMYMKCKDVRGARQVFYRMLERDLLSWNSMISGLVYNGLLEEAVQYFGHMRLDGFEPDTVTLNTTMDAYCRLGLCEEAWKIFAQIKEPNIISWTTLISGYSRMGKHKLSLGIFRDLMYKEMVIPDVDSLSSIIVSCRHLNFPLNGREIHGYGIKTKKWIVFYKSAGPALLTMYAKCGRFQDAVNIFESMDQSDVVTWNAMILGFVDLACTNMALEYFSRLQRMGLKNDQTTISTVLPACDLNSGKQIHVYIRKYLFNSVLVWNALINMYCKCGHIGYAYNVFSNMVTRDLVSWNTMIGGFGMHGLGRDALQLLYEMINSGLSPDSVTITSVLSACSHSGLADEGLKIFNSIMKEHSITPRIEHFTCVVDMLARAGRLEDAVNFITRMPSEPNKHIWGALLAASRAHQNVNVGILAAEQLIHLEPENAGHYITLSNIYARAGRWDDAVMMRKKMEDEGLVKPSGQSWIEGGN